MASGVLDARMGVWLAMVCAIVMDFINTKRNFGVNNK